MRFEFGEFVLDADARELYRGTQSVRLSPKALRLLEILVAARPRAIGKDELMHELWPDTFVVEANLSNLVGELRAAMGDATQQPRFLRTVPRFGYAFIAADVPRRSTRVLWEVSWHGGRVALGEGTHVIGRGEDDVRLAARSVSRAHARVVVSADRLTYEDLGSKNGSARGGQPLQGVVDVHDGDEIRVGAVAVTFSRIRHESTETIERSALPMTRRDP